MRQGRETASRARPSLGLPLTADGRAPSEQTAEIEEIFHKSHPRLPGGDQSSGRTRRTTGVDMAPTTSARFGFGW